MTVLRLVRETEHGHSVKAPLTDDQLADLQWISRNILADSDLAVTELRHAIVNRNHAAAIAACNRLLQPALWWQDVKAQFRS